MNPGEIGRDYQCEIRVIDFRIVKKAEYQIQTKLTFFSTRTQCKASTTWTVWRSFNMFRSLDEQLRKRCKSHMKGIKFPRIHRRRSVFRKNFSSAFLEKRSADLNIYLTMITCSPDVVAFHLSSIQSQALKSFIGYVNGFGSNEWYARTPISNTATTSHASFIHRNILSTTTSNSMVDHSYRWSGTGFLGSASFVGNNRIMNNNTSHQSLHYMNGMPKSNLQIPFIEEKEDLGQINTVVNQNKKNMDIPLFRNPNVEEQRIKMETQLLSSGLKGVGMPPDGSCLLHCLIYEMYSLNCLKDYPSEMSVVNIGSGYGVAPRRVEAANFLRIKLAEYGLAHLKNISTFLLQNMDELRERFITFRDVSSEQATVVELYTAASMFNIRIVLITNDNAFKVDPVLPIDGLPSIRSQEKEKIITLGYLLPANGISGHYICTKSINELNNNNHIESTHNGSI